MSVLIAGDVAFKSAGRILTIGGYMIVGGLSLLNIMFKKGNIDLSIAAMMGLSAFIMTSIAQNTGLPIGIGIIIACLICLIIGAVHGLVVSLTRLPAIIVTLQTALIIRFLLPRVFGNEFIPLKGSITSLASGYLFGSSYISPMVVSMVIVFLIAIPYIIIRFLLNKKQVARVLLITELLMSLALFIIQGVFIGGSPGVPYVLIIIFGFVLLVDVLRLAYLQFEKQTDPLKRQILSDIADFMMCSFVAASSGILMAMRLGGYTPMLGRNMLPTLILIALIGGASIMGHRGTGMSIFFGGLVVTLIATTMSLIAIDVRIQQIIIIGLLGVMIVVDIIRNIIFRKKTELRYVLGLDIKWLKHITSKKQ